MGSNSSIYLNPSNGAYNHYGSPNSSLKLNNSSQLLKYSNSYRDVPLFAETLKSPPDENESL